MSAALGRRMIGGSDLAGDVGLDGAQQNALAADAGEKLFEEKRGCRLAVGSGNTAEFEAALGMAEDCGAHLGESAAAVLDEGDWQVGSIALKPIEGLRRIRDDRCCALLERCVDEAVAVGRAAAHSDEDIAWANAARVIVHALYLSVVARDLQRPQVCVDVVPSHRSSHQSQDELNARSVQRSRFRAAPSFRPQASAPGQGRCRGSRRAGQV